VWGENGFALLEVSFVLGMLITLLIKSEKLSRSRIRQKET